MQSRIVINANCQGKALWNYLVKVEYFTNWDFKYISNYEPLKDEHVQWISSADVFIYQPVSDTTNNMNNTDETGLLKHLTSECRRICFPSIYCDMFPIYEKGSLYTEGGQIDNYIENGYTLTQLLELFDNGSFFFDLERRFTNSIMYMRGRERYCNIIVSDFIANNYKHHKLFNTQNHPTGIVLMKVAIDVCNLLNIEHGLNMSDIWNEYTYNIVPSLEWKNSIYMYKELGITYSYQYDDNHYRDLIMYLFNNRELIERFAK